MRLALDEAAERDPDFLRVLESAVRRVTAQHRTSGTVTATTGTGVAVGGNMDTRAADGSVAVGFLAGNVTIGIPSAARPAPQPTAPAVSQDPRHASDTAVTATHGGTAIGHADIAYVREPERPRRARALLAAALLVVAGGATAAALLTLHRPSSRDSQGQSSPNVAAPTSSSSASPSPATTPSAAPHTSGLPLHVPGPGPVPIDPVRATTAAPPPIHHQYVTFTVGSTVRLKNVYTHECVAAGDGTFAGAGTCGSDDTYAWTLRPSVGSTFEVVNPASNNCLMAPSMNDYMVLVGSCDEQYGPQGYPHWRVKSATAKGQTLQNTETGHCLEIAQPYSGGEYQPMVTSCDSGRSDQLWQSDGTT